MYINKNCTTAFVQPFTKCKKFQYDGWACIIGPGHDADNAKFLLYKDQDTQPSFTVTRGFIIGLIERNKLNINSIESSRLFSHRFKDPKMIPTLDEDESCEQTFSKLFLIEDEEDAKITLEAKNPLTFENVLFDDDYKALEHIDLNEGESCEQTFSKLFLIEDEEDAKITLEAKNPLTFGNVEFRDDYKALKHIDLILNLNAYSVSIMVSNVPNSSCFNPLPYAHVSKPVAERTKKLSINYNIEPEPPLENDAGFNSKKWLAFINYVLCACPNLELLKIRIRVIKSANSQCFSNSINDVVEKIFPSLGENVHSRIVIEFQDNFFRIPEDSLDEFKIEEPGVRVVKYISPKNGTEYLCRLNVYSEDDNFENYPEHRPLCVIL